MKPSDDHLVSRCYWPTLGMSRTDEGGQDPRTEGACATIALNRWSAIPSTAGDCHHSPSYASRRFRPSFRYANFCLRLLTSGRPRDKLAAILKSGPRWCETTLRMLPGSECSRLAVRQIIHTHDDKLSQMYFYSVRFSIFLSPSVSYRRFESLCQMLLEKKQPALKDSHNAPVLDADRPYTNIRVSDVGH